MKLSLNWLQLQVVDKENIEDRVVSEDTTEDQTEDFTMQERDQKSFMK